MVAILRGINVGGKNKIKMDDLRGAVERSGLKKVRSYIQSGNLVFESGVRSVPNLQNQIRATIEADFGLTVPVIVRSGKVFRETIEQNPWCEDPGIDPKHLHVTFFDQKPAKTKIDAVQQPAGSDDPFRCFESAAYIVCPNGYSNTKLTNAFFESKLGVVCTTRNWKTCLAIQALLD